MTDRQYNPLGSVAAPAAWTLASRLQIELKTAFAHFNGTGAAGSYVPCLRIKSDSGHVVCEAVASTSVAAGASADVSWFPAVGAQAVGPTPVGPGLLIYDYTVTAATKASIDTMSDGPYAGTLDQRFSALTLWTVLRTDEAVVSSQVSMYFNHDSTIGNYDLQYLEGVNTTVVANQQVGPPGFDVMGANADAGYAGVALTSIPAYAQTYFYKQALTIEGQNEANVTKQRILTWTQGWRNTAALTRIELAPFTAGVKLVQGSRLMILAS